MSDAPIDERYEVAAETIAAQAELESLRSRLASTQLELTHEANTCADQQRRAENAEAALVEGDALLREARTWFIPLNSINDKNRLAARIDAFLARDSHHE